LKTRASKEEEPCGARATTDEKDSRFSPYSRKFSKKVSEFRNLAKIYIIVIVTAPWKKKEKKWKNQQLTLAFLRELNRQRITKCLV